MKNSVFQVEFDKTRGTIGRLSLCGDEHGMNFVKAGATFGDVYVTFIEPEAWMPVSVALDLTAFEETDERAWARYERNGIVLTVEYFFAGENLKAVYKVTNANRYPYYFQDGDVRLGTAFNDSFIGSAVCMKHCCHEHIWPALQSSYIYAERMGESTDSVGVFFDSGRFSGYTHKL